MGSAPAPDEATLLQQDHDDGQHAEYIAECPGCRAEFDTPADPPDPDVPVVRPEPTTPYDRLVERLTGPHRCQHCGRTDPLTPAGVAAMVGLSETSVRRLIQADAGPSLRAVATMATTLDVPVTTLLGELWPALAQPAP